jgi:ribosomal 50S subunit-recycling heat shock protein
MLTRAVVGKMKHLAQQASATSTTKLKEIKMPATAQAMRIDTFLSAPEYFHISRTQAQKLIDNGDVYVNGKSVLKKSMHIKPNDSVSVAVAELPPTQQTTKPQQTTTPKPPPTKKVQKKDEEDSEGEESEANGESAEVDGEGDEADELESGPTNATGPLITPIDILFSTYPVSYLSLSQPTCSAQHYSRG